MPIQPKYAIHLSSTYCMKITRSSQGWLTVCLSKVVYYRLFLVSQPNYCYLNRTGFFCLVLNLKSSLLVVKDLMVTSFSWPIPYVVASCSTIVL